MKGFKLLGMIFALLFMVSIFLGSGFSVTDQDLSDNTIEFWTHDNDFVSGSISIGSVGNYNATINGVTTGATGQINESFSLDGIDDYVNTSSYSRNSSALTYSLWIKTTSSDGDYTFLSEDTSSFSFEPNSGGDWIGIRYNGATLWDTNNIDTINDGNWHHILLTVGDVTSPTTTTSLYIDSNNQGSPDLLSEGSIDSASNLDIGRNYGDTNYFDGSIDEVWIKGEAMTENEISEYYNRSSQQLQNSQYPFTSGETPVSTGQFARYINTPIFNQSVNGSDIFQYAYSGNVSTYPDKNDGTLNGYTFNNGTLINFDNTTRVQSVNSSYGGALEFDGVDDYVEIDDSSLLNDFSSITICGYIREDGTSFNDLPGTLLGQSNQIEVRNDASGAFFRVRNETSTSFISYNYDKTQLSHYCAIWDSNSQYIAIALNGIIVTEKYNAVKGTLRDAFNNLYIGTTTSTVYNLNGSIDNVIIYDRALNETEVQEQYESPLPIDNPVAYYSFNEYNGTTAYDTNHITKGVAENDVTHVDNGAFNLTYPNKAMSFDGVDDYLDLGDEQDNMYEGTVTMWMLDQSKQDYNIMTLTSAGVDETGGDSYFRCGSSGHLILNLYNGTSGTSYTSFPQLGNCNSGEWTNIAFTLNATHIALYSDGILLDTFANEDNYYFKRDINYHIGQYRGTPRSDNLHGSIDNVMIYNRSLSHEEIQNLYYSGLGNNTDQVNTTGLVAQYGFQEMQSNKVHDRNNQLCVNCDSSTITYEYPAITASYTNWYYEEISNTTDYNYFTIDLDDPVLDESLPAEINDYTINFSQYINYSDVDSGVDYCNVSISGESYTTCNDSSYTFATNGNKAINITLADKAGNIVTDENNVVFINPYQYFNFETPTGTKIYNFTFRGEFFEETARFKIFDLVSENDLPTNKTLLFEKVGYEDTNITLLFNSTSEYNQTDTITLAKIVVHIYDRQTENLLTNSVELTLIDGIGDNATTSTGKYNFTKESFIEGEYHIIAQSEGYSTEVVYFDFDNQEIVNVDIYMLNNTLSNFGTIQLIAKDRFSRFVDGALCQAKEWKSAQSSYSLVTEGLTNTNGEVLLDIELGTKEYIFTCTKEDYSATTEPEIIKTDLATRTLVLTKAEEEEIEELSGLTYSISPDEDNYLDKIVNNSATIEFNYTDSNKQVVKGCIKYYKKEGLSKELLGENCSNSASANLVKTFNTNNSFTLVAEASVTTATGKNFVLQSFSYPSNINIRDFLVKYGLDIIIPTVLILLSIGLGLIAKNIYISLVLIDICVWFIYAILPNKMPGQAAMTITLLIGLIMWGVYRRK